MANAGQHDQAAVTEFDHDGRIDGGDREIVLGSAGAAQDSGGDDGHEVALAREESEWVAPVLMECGIGVDFGPVFICGKVEGEQVQERAPARHRDELEFGGVGAVEDVLGCLAQTFGGDCDQLVTAMLRAGGDREGDATDGAILSAASGRGRVEREANEVAFGSSDDAVAGQGTDRVGVGEKLHRDLDSRVGRRWAGPAADECTHERPRLARRRGVFDRGGMTADTGGGGPAKGEGNGRRGGR